MPGRFRRPVMMVMMRGLVMGRRLVMKAQQVHAEVVAVGRVDDGVNVEFLRFGIVQHNPALVIELDHHHRTLNAIIESTLFSHAAGPTEMGLQEMPFDIVHAGRKRTGGQCG